MKVAHILLALAFEAGCVGLWVVMGVLAMLHRAYPFPQHNDGGGTLAQGDFETFCILHAAWLPYLGIPVVAYAAAVCFRRKATVESFCLFASALALAFAVLFFTVIVASMVSWIPVYD